MALWCMYSLKSWFQMPALISLFSTFSLQFSQHFFEVVKAEFSSGGRKIKLMANHFSNKILKGFFDYFRTGHAATEEASAVFTRSKRYNLLKADDRQEACRVAAAVLKQLYNLQQK